MTSLQDFSSICRSTLLTLLAVSVAWAQAQQPAVANPSSSFASELTEHRNAEQSGHERIFGLVPNHNTLPNLSMVAPLGTGAKFRLAGADSFDQAAFLLAGIYAGAGQWQRQYPTFGSGAAGFGKRYVTAYADQVIGNYMNEAIFPTILHQDPRYYRMSHGGFLNRTTYAVSRVLVTRSDSGASRFNFSQVAGTATTAAIANIYYPDRSVSSTIQRFGLQLASGGVFNVLKEYWPDIRQKFSFRRSIGTSNRLIKTRDAELDKRDARAAVVPEPSLR
jgi:hypothetical protein